MSTERFVMLAGMIISKECFALFADVPRFDDMYISGEISLDNPVEVLTAVDYKLSNDTAVTKIKCDSKFFANVKFGEYYKVQHV